MGHESSSEMYVTTALWDDPSYDKSFHSGLELQRLSAFLSHVPYYSWAHAAPVVEAGHVYRALPHETATHSHRHRSNSHVKFVPRE